ncbi:MAG: SEC-C domain-containing protein, partial [Planctomycetes bacterium]|nr:SEC-C domain-containing protein [Planctomycetota bacterium]
VANRRLPSNAPFPVSAWKDDAEYEAAPAATTIRHAAPRVGRNEPCPCGSGKKFKKCCGAR